MVFNNAEVMKCLPLVASVLGKKYSVSVEFGKSKTAYTDGRTVYIPDIEQTEEGVRLARGYIDHEAGGHLRFTDFNSWNNAHLDKTQYFICNAIEDWRVERKLREIYPGCGENLDWISRRFFAHEKIKNSGDEIRDCLNYILMSVRSWDTPEIADANGLVLKIDLKKSLDSILDEVKASCRSTSDAVDYARRLGEIVEKEARRQKEGRAGASDRWKTRESANNNCPQQERNDCHGGTLNESQGATHDDSGSLEREQGEGCSTGSGQTEGCGQLSADGSGSQLKNVGDLLQEALGANARQGSKDGHARLVPATVIDVPVDGSGFRYMTQEERREALVESAKLRTKLQAVLMSKVAKRSWVGSSGRKLSSRFLSRVAVGSSKVFSRVVDTEGFDVHVELLLDCSSSMAGSAIKLALNACYTIAYALLDIPGIQVNIDSFPCSCEITIRHVQFSRNRWPKINTCGTTPLGAVLIHYLQKIIMIKSKSKICIIISDGMPDTVEDVNKAISYMKMIDIDAYGVEIQNHELEKYLDSSNCICINSIYEIQYSLFRLISNKI